MQVLRNYQKDLLNEIKIRFSAGKKRIALMSPVGSGKTIMAKSVVNDALEKGNQVLFTVHRKVLLEQTYKEFIPYSPSVVMGTDDRFNSGSQLQVAMIQSLINREIPEPKIVCIDEVHYGWKSKLVQSILTRFPKAYIIGMSATPVDERGYLLEGFDSIIDKYQMVDLIELGWLVPFEVYSPIQLDLSSVSLRAGDYVDAELANVVDHPKIVGTVIDNYEEFGQDRKFICFALNQEHGKNLTAEFIHRGIQVGYIDAKTGDGERKYILEQLKSGQIRGVVNIGVLTAGFNEPTVSCIIIANPSKSWRKFIQECGRGCRLLGETFEQSVLNGKQNCVLIDLANVIDEHGLPDRRVKLKFKPTHSRIIDRELGIDENTEERNEILEDISASKKVYLKKIGSVLDLYDGKVYKNEKFLLEDIIKFLKKSDLFYYRQNSGVAQFGWVMTKSVTDFISAEPSYAGDLETLRAFTAFTKDDARFVQFTSKAGLPDVTLNFRLGSVYFGIEVKMPKGVLTKHQKNTLPEMIENKSLIFFAQSVYDAYKILEHIEDNIIETSDSIIIKKTIYKLPEKQLEYYKRYKLKPYE